MNSLVKNVFLLIMGVVVAVLLYFAFFGYHPDDTDDYYTGDEWNGALWFAADAVQIPLSRYYYEFCYLPNIHIGKDMDIALGGKDLVTNIQSTNPNASSLGDDIDFAQSGEFIWSTGWQ